MPPVFFILLVLFIFLTSTAIVTVVVFRNLDQQFTDKVSVVARKLKLKTTAARMDATLVYGIYDRNNVTTEASCSDQNCGDDTNVKTVDSVAQVTLTSEHQSRDTNDGITVMSDTEHKANSESTALLAESTTSNSNTDEDGVHSEESNTSTGSATAVRRENWKAELHFLTQRAFVLNTVERFAVSNSTGNSVTRITRTDTSLLVPTESRKATWSSGVCETADCVLIAHLYRLSVNKSANPCQNFYKYVCSSSKLSHSEEGKVNATIGIREAFLKITPSGSPQSASHKAKAFYDKCMGRRQDTSENLREIHSFFDLNNLSFEADNTSDPFLTTLRLLLVHGIQVFLGIGIGDLTTAAGNYVLLVYQSEEFIFWSRRKRNFTSLIEYQHFVAERFSKLGITDPAYVRWATSRLHEAEEKIFSIRPNSSESGVLGWNIKDYITAESMLPKWLLALSIYSNGTFGLTNIVASEKSVRIFLNSVFASISASYLNIYIAWEVARQLLSVSGALDRDASDYSRQCYSMALSLMKYAVISVYFEPLLITSRINDVIDMIHNINDKIERNINKSDWVESTQKIVLVKRLRNMKYQVAFPKGLRTAEAIEEMYLTYPDGNECFVKTYLNVAASRIAYVYKLYNTQGHDILRLDFNNLQFASYYRHNNVIYIPALLLVPPAHNDGAPPEINYGHLGQTITHDIMVVLAKALRANTGRARSYNWTSKNSYLERITCYENSTKSIPTPRTVAEFLEDVLGFKSLYEAYKDAKLNSSSAWTSDLQGHSSDQLFFIARCFLFCAHNSYAASDGLPRNAYRCNVPLSHFEEFAAAFSCPEGSRPNPHKMCEPS
ncbi:endothelin-converting enzyme 1-like isoform X2 [Ornithodoros turicata]